MPLSDHRTMEELIVAMDPVVGLCPGVILSTARLGSSVMIVGAELYRGPIPEAKMVSDHIREIRARIPSLRKGVAFLVVDDNIQGRVANAEAYFRKRNDVAVGGGRVGRDPPAARTPIFHKNVAVCGKQNRPEKIKAKIKLGGDKELVYALALNAMARQRLFPLPSGE